MNKAMLACVSKFIYVFVAALSAESLAADHRLTDKQLNHWSSGYDSTARFEYSHNDVLSFVYSWFAAFDHQQPAGYFLNRIAVPVDLHYPDFKIASKQGFLAWYQGVTDNIRWNSHQLQNVEITGEQKKGWQVSYKVRWQAKDKSGKHYDMTVQQQMTVIRYGDLLKISRLRAKVL